MAKQYKVDEVKSLVDKLKNRNNFILTNYSGVKVKELSELRNQIREKNAEYKVVKNNLFKIALNEAGYEDLNQYLKGPIGVAFAGEEIGEVAKLLKDFSKEEKMFSFSAGVLNNILYDESQIRRIADLPSIDGIRSQMLTMFNGPTTGIAVGINQIMSSLARGIKAVAEK